MQTLAVAVVAVAVPNISTTSSMSKSVASASPFSTAPAVALSRDQLLRYDGGAGLWRNTDIIDGGSID